MNPEIASTAKALIDDVLQEGLNGVSSTAPSAPSINDVPESLRKCVYPLPKEGKGCCLLGLSLCTFLNPSRYFEVLCNLLFV